MKIIEALKKVKDLYRKADDIREKLAKYCVKMSFESDAYDNQREKMDGWLQCHRDLILEIERLRESIAKTNVETQVTIEVEGKEVTKSIHNWISRRRDLLGLEMMCWRQLTDKGLNNQKVKMSNGEVQEFKLVRFYDPEKKDKMLDHLQSELSTIDSKLEIVNATTELV